MGIAEEPKDAKLFLAVMYASGDDREAALRAFQNEFGKVEYTFGPVPFDYTSYYNKEMGEGLKKVYMVFDRPIKRAALPDIKLRTNGIEADFAVDGNRIVNFDPGYLTNDKLVLASTKDFFHRLYLGKGIYGEVTLHYRQGRYRHFSWTYQDYRDPEFQAFLEKARAVLVGSMRKAARKADE